MTDEKAQQFPGSSPLAPHNATGQDGTVRADKLTKRALRITRCSDPLMWYARLVGQTVPLLGHWPEGFKSREPAGHVNLVKYWDAEIVEVANS